MKVFRTMRYVHYGHSYFSAGEFGAGSISCVRLKERGTADLSLD